MAVLTMTGIDTQAQKFHQIIFCNTIDSKIGPTCARDEDRVVSEIGAIAESIGYEPVLYIYGGEKCTKENLMNVLNSLNCSANDVVLFYYSGHGIHAKGNMEDKFPQMCLKYSYSEQENFVPVRVANEIITRKNPRLSIIMSDCCNDIDIYGGISVKSNLQSRGINIVKRNSKENYHRLFVSSKGNIVATGCKLGQQSGCTMEDGIGGIFTYFFCEELVSQCENSSNVTWDNVLAGVKKTVARETRNEQEPYYVININGGGGSGGNTNVTPAPPSSQPAFATTSPFSQAVAELLSTQNLTTRANMVSRIMQKCFNNKTATIITLGRNLKTVVDYEQAKDYLTRLAANKKIIGINVLKDVTDQNGKSFITVTAVRTE